MFQNALLKVAGLRVVNNARCVLKHAWSVRFLFLATTLDTLQGSVQFFAGTDVVSPGTLVTVNLVLTLAALGARLIAQEKVSGPAPAGDA